MTVNKNLVSVSMPGREMDALEEIAQEMDMSKSAVMRAAFRLYQSVHCRIKAGESMAFVDKDGNVIKQVIIGCGKVD